MAVFITMEGNERNSHATNIYHSTNSVETMMIITGQIEVDNSSTLKSLVND